MFVEFSFELNYSKSMSQFSLFHLNGTNKNKSNTRKKITPFIPVVENGVTMLNHDFVGSKIGSKKQVLFSSLK